MSGTRLHRLTTIYLAVVYGVVGLTGESLHYLVSDPTVLWSSWRSGETVVFYHRHGPGDHGHFHRHVHDGDHRHGTYESAGGADRANQTAALTTQFSSHQSHDCPILSVVSTLKLGHGGMCKMLIVLDALVTPSSESGVVAALNLPRSLGARGPPSGLIA
jgi:hypothetical protein